jgi:hypothetical protein
MIWAQKSWLKKKQPFMPYVLSFWGFKRPLGIEPNQNMQNSWITILATQLPSGKHTKNYGQSLFFMGKSTN